VVRITTEAALETNEHRSSSPIALRHLSIHGHDVGYRMEGRGPVVLLIHGLAGSSRTWREAMPLLTQNYTVVAPDLLGHGESAKPMGDYSLGAHASGLRDLLFTLGIERATIVGQSLGGGVAMQLAYQHPDLCERLVLVGSGGLGREVSLILRLLALPGAEYAMPLVFPPFVRSAGDSLMGWMGQRGLRNPRVEEMWRAYGSLTDVQNRRAFVRTLRAVVDHGGQSVSAKDRLYLAAAVPTLIVWGDDDSVIPVSHAYDAHEEMPGSRLEIFEGASHFPHAEDPHRFVDVLDDFITTTDAADTSVAAWQASLRQGSGPFPADRATA
jgi:pimeloyl-ACP methyl ester carboxylesterase